MFHTVLVFANRSVIATMHKQARNAASALSENERNTAAIAQSKNDTAINSPRRTYPALQVAKIVGGRA